ncbi:MULTISPECIES: hypothetical protein [unclassified Geodermatophilus]
MTLARAASAGYTALVLGAVLVPALAVRAAGGRGGSGTAGSEDLLAVSVVVGVAAAVLARRRLLGGRPSTSPPTGRWPAALCALGVLGVGAAGLPALALYATARLPPDLTGQPWVAPALWAAGLLMAVLVSAGTDRALSGWLDDGRSSGRSGCGSAGGSRREEPTAQQRRPSGCGDLTGPASRGARRHG